MKLKWFVLCTTTICILSIGLNVLKTSQALPILGTLGEFELIDQEGQPFHAHKLSHKVWIVDSIFTRCHGPCPLMSQTLTRLQNELATIQNIAFLSITVDPEFDTPQILATYKAHYAPQSPQWTLLTGEHNQISLVLRQFLNIPADAKNPDLHSTKFILIDHNHQIRGYYDSHDEQALVLLKEHAKQMAQF